MKTTLKSRFLQNDMLECHDCPEEGAECNGDGVFVLEKFWISENEGDGIFFTIRWEYFYFEIQNVKIRCFHTILGSLSFLHVHQEHAVKDLDIVLTKNTA